MVVSVIEIVGIKEDNKKILDLEGIIDARLRESLPVLNESVRIQVDGVNERIKTAIKRMYREVGWEVAYQYDTREFIFYYTRL